MHVHECNDDDYDAQSDKLIDYVKNNPLMDYLPIAWRVKNVKREVVAISSAYLDLVQLPDEKILGHTDDDFSWVYDANLVETIETSVLEGNCPRHESVKQYIIGSGKTMTLRINIVPIKNKAEQIIGLLETSIVDAFNGQSVPTVSNENSLTERLYRTMLNNLRHDWITPFNGVYSINDVLANEETEPEKKELLSMAKNSAQRLLTHVTSILEMIAAANGEPRLQETKMDPWKICQDVHHIFLPEATRKKLTFVGVQNHEPVEMLGDPLRFERIVMCLVSNAIKFTDEG